MFDRLDKEFDFTLDPCGNRARLLKSPDRMTTWTADEDGLSRSWAGERVFVNPPYTCGFANEWIEHPKDLPRPKRILHEASRVVKSGGLIAILHVIVIPAYKTAKVERIALHGILCGPNNAIRVLNVFRKVA
jgi:hypothetical protein